MSTADNTKPPKTRTTNTKHTRVESGDQRERERERCKRSKKTKWDQQAVSPLDDKVRLV
jgi:hypothetical protein